MVLASTIPAWQAEGSCRSAEVPLSARSCASAAAFGQMPPHRSTPSTYPDLPDQASNGRLCTAPAVLHVFSSIRPGFLWRDAAREKMWTEQELQVMKQTFPAQHCQIESFALCSEEGSDTALLGIFEGSGKQGREIAVAAAAYAKQQLASCWQHSHRLQDALRSLCTATQTDLQQRRGSDKLDLQLSGCTAAFAVIQRSRVTWCSLGNTAGVIGRCHSGQPSCQELPCSPSLTVPQEVARVQGCGGSVIVGPNAQCPLLTGPRLSEAGVAGIALGRSLGHRIATFAGLSCDPTVHCQRLDAPETSSLLVAANGALWQVMSSAEVLQFVDRYSACPWEGVSASAALTLEAQQRWKAAHAAVMVPAMAAIVLEIPCVTDSKPSARYKGLRPCPPNYPPSGASNAAACAKDVATPAQESFAHLGPTFFDCCEEVAKPLKATHKAAAQNGKKQRPEAALLQHQGEKSKNRLWRALAGMSIIPAAAYADVDADADPADTRPDSRTAYSPPRPVTPPATAVPSPSRSVKIIAPESGKLKPPLRATSNLQAARTASGHLESLLASLARNSSTDLCLPRFSIPETQPMSMPRVRSASAIASLLLPVRKAYPSSERLALTSSGESEREGVVPPDLLAKTVSSLPSASGLQDTPPETSLLNGTGPDASPPQRLRGLSTQEGEAFNAFTRGKSLSVGASPVKENSRVHGGNCSPAARVPSFAAYMALNGGGNEPAGDNTAQSLDLQGEQPKQPALQQQDTGKRVYSSLLRRSLNHLSSVPPSPFLSQCLRPPATSSAGMHAPAWAEDEEISADSSMAVLNPWSDQDDGSGGKDRSSSRDPSVGSSMTSPLAHSSSKLRGGSSALRMLRSTSSVLATMSMDPATSDGFPVSSYDLSVMGSSSHADRPSFELPSEASNKQRGSSLALDALQSSGSSLSPSTPLPSPPSPRTPTEASAVSL